MNVSYIKNKIKRKHKRRRIINFFEEADVSEFESPVETVGKTNSSSNTFEPDTSILNGHITSEALKQKINKPKSSNKCQQIVYSSDENIDIKHEELSDSILQDNAKDRKTKKVKRPSAINSPDNFHEESMVSSSPNNERKHKKKKENNSSRTIEDLSLSITSPDSNSLEKNKIDAEKLNDETKIIVSINENTEPKCLNQRNSTEQKDDFLSKQKKDDKLEKDDPTEDEKVENLSGSGCNDKTNLLEGHKNNDENEESDHSSEDENKKSHHTINDEYEFSISNDKESFEVTNYTTITEKQKNKLESLFIERSFEVPQLHRIETRISASLTNDQRQQIKELNLSYKSGPYLKEEDEIIKTNWTEFCKLNELNEKDSEAFCNVKNIPLKDRIPFLRFLGRNLNNRLLTSIYKRFQVLYKKEKKGKFSENEDDTIMKYMTNNQKKGKSFATLARILRRDRLSIEKRYMKLKIKNNEKFKWKKNDIELFIRNLLEVTLCINSKELKSRVIKREEWVQLSEKMDVPVQKLKFAWFSNIYPRLFIEQPISDIRISIIKKLYKMKVSDWRAVDWRKLAKDYVGCNCHFLYKLFKNMVRTYVPEEHRKNARDSIKYLKKNCLEKVFQAPVKRKLEYEDGILHFIPI